MTITTPSILMVPNGNDKPLPYTVFDFETQESPPDIPGGWNAARSEGAAGFSCGTLWDSSDQFLYLYSPQMVSQLADALEAARVIVSYNGKGFDIPAIEGMLHRKLNINAHVDLLDLLFQTTGTRKGLSLANISHFTLGVEKGGKAEDAPKLYQKALVGGDDGLHSYIELLNYCAKDVILTRDVLRFLQENGYVVGPNGPIHVTLPPWFGRLV